MLRCRFRGVEVSLCKQTLWPCGCGRGSQMCVCRCGGGRLGRSRRKECQCLGVGIGWLQSHGTQWLTARHLSSHSSSCLVSMSISAALALARTRTGLVRSSSSPMLLPWSKHKQAPRGRRRFRSTFHFFTKPSPFQKIGRARCRRQNPAAPMTTRQRTRLSLRIRSPSDDLWTLAPGVSSAYPSVASLSLSLRRTPLNRMSSRSIESSERRSKGEKILHRPRRPPSSPMYTCLHHTPSSASVSVVYPQRVQMTKRLSLFT